jgi:hypothetical protein
LVTCLFVLLVLEWDHTFVRFVCECTTQAKDKRREERFEKCEAAKTEKRRAKLEHKRVAGESVFFVCLCVCLWVWVRACVRACVWV